MGASPRARTAMGQVLADFRRSRRRNGIPVAVVIVCAEQAMQADLICPDETLTARLQPILQEAVTRMAAELARGPNPAAAAALPAPTPEPPQES